jgi:hypothetical protein
MTPQSPRASAHLVVSVASALVAVSVFLMMTLPFGFAGLTAPAPAPIFLGAAILTIVMPPVRDFIARLVERHPRWASPDSYELVALGARLEPKREARAVLSQLAEFARRSVNGRSATIQTEIGDAESGTPESVAFSATVMHGGGEIALITVTSSSALKSQQRRRVEQLASSIGVVVANAVAIDSIERRISELDRTIKLITQRRRSLVEAETAERERVARAVVAGAEPVFQQLRASVAAGDFDGAAKTCEQLIVFLRGFSTAMRET